MTTAAERTRARAEAENLAGALPAILLEARRLAAAASGVHGRRRAGQGEAFWQFRDHRPEDGARLVDWRRSGRGERLYVRERELEAAQSALFWIDPDPGFHWTSDPTEPTKAQRALVLSLAFAMLLARGGERVGRLGGGALRAGPRAAERLAEDLALAASPIAPPPPPARAVVIYASDGYQPLEVWRARLKAAASVGARGAVLLVSDPAEEDFPFKGRVRFERPGARDTVLFGKAETAKEAYAKRLSEHRASLAAIARGFDFLVATHRTDRSAAPCLSLVASGLSERR